MERVEPLDLDVISHAAWRAERLDFRNRTRWRLLRAKQSGGKHLYGFCGLQSLAEVGHSAFTPKLTAAAIRAKADLYIGHYVAALPAVAKAARINRARYSFDAEDFHPGDQIDTREHELDKQLIRAIESCYLPSCTYITASSELIAQAYSEIYGIEKPTVVLNAFSRGDARPTNTEKENGVRRPSVYWFSQTIGPLRGLECAVRALGYARSQPHLYLRGTVAPGFIEHLRSIAAASDMSDHLHILPPAMPSEMERLAAVFDVGYSGEEAASANNRYALGNKLFSYLVAGLAIVASEVPSHQKFAGELGEAIQLFKINDERDLALKWDELLLQPGRLAAARAASLALGLGRYNWECEQLKLLDCVNRALWKHA
jgi:hypothetical protein